MQYVLSIENKFCCNLIVNYVMNIDTINCTISISYFNLILLSTY